MPLLAEEGSPSPPIRRSISTDRGAHIKGRIKPDTPDNPPITKIQYPTRASINRSLATLSILPSTENKRGYLSSQDNFSEALHNLPRVNSRKANQGQEEEQFKQMLNVRQGGIGKLKLENNQVKAKHQLPVKIHKSDLLGTVFSDMDDGGTVEEGQRSDFSEPENEHVSIKSHIPMGMKKLQRSSSRSSHNVEVREPGQTLQSLMTAGRNENKPSNGAKNGNEGSNVSMPKFRRSRSTPRGKFMVLP